MERDSLHEIHPSSSSLPDEPDFSPGRSRLVIDSQENNEFPPRSSALCQIHPWCDSAHNNPLAPWMSLFSPLAWSSSLSGSAWRWLRELFSSLLLGPSNCTSQNKPISWHFWSFQANCNYISLTKLTIVLLLFMITGITADEKFVAEHTHLQPPELKRLLTLLTIFVCYNICLKETSSRYTTLTGIYLCSSTSCTQLIFLSLGQWKDKEFKYLKVYLAEKIIVFLHLHHPPCNAFWWDSGKGKHVQNEVKKVHRSGC